MGKHQKPEVLHQVYRQFSRQKYNKYKHQFPKMRESEIVSKIIREWDSLGTEGKQKLHKLYENNKFLMKQDFSQVQSGQKSVEKIKIEKSSLENTEEKPTAVKVELKEQRQIVSDFDKYVNSEQLSEKRSIDSGSLATPQAKSKKSSTIGRNDYLTFFKHYYEKYSKEHPKWTASQISKVIALLWSKRKQQYRVVSVKKQKNSKPLHKVNGRRLFKRIKKLNADEIKVQWSNLPKQSKILWSYPGKQLPIPLNKREGKMVLKSNSNVESNNVFGFLSKLIR